MITIAVIGCGNMAAPIVETIHQSFGDIHFLTFTPTHAKAKDLAQKVQGKAALTLEDLSHADIFLLGFKPQQLNDFVKEQGNLLKGKTVISLLTAIPLQTLQEKLNTIDVCRVMPNTPAKVGKGVMLAHFAKNFSKKSVVSELFQSCGLVVELEEQKLDQLTVFTGSGPAYIFFIAKIYVDQMQALGIKPDLAEKMIRQLFFGAGELMQHSDYCLQQMIDEVTSKGGVTIEAIRELEGSDISSLIAQSLERALSRNREISAEFSVK